MVVEPWPGGIHRAAEVASSECPPRNPRDGIGKALLPLSPADVLNASLPLLLELHVSLDSLLQVQDRGILYDDHSCMNTYRRKIHVGCTYKGPGDGRHPGLCSGSTHPGMA